MYRVFYRVPFLYVTFSLFLLINPLQLITLTILLCPFMELFPGLITELLIYNLSLSKYKNESILFLPDRSIQPCQNRPRRSDSVGRPSNMLRKIHWLEVHSIKFRTRSVLTGGKGTLWHCRELSMWE